MSSLLKPLYVGATISIGIGIWRYAMEDPGFGSLLIFAGLGAFGLQVARNRNSGT